MITSAADSDARWAATKELARRLAARGALEVPIAEVSDLEPQLRELIESGTLLDSRGKIKFFHENFLDFVFARTFAEDESSIIEYVRAGPQDLHLRPTVRRVLEYQREEDRVAFLESAERLITANDIRFFIKDVVFGVLQQDDQPTASLWNVLKHLALDPDSPGHHAAWQIIAEQRWLRFLDDSGEILRWMASVEERERDAAMRLLSAMQRRDSDRVAVLVTPFVGLLDWDTRLRWLLRFGDGPGAGRAYFDLTLRALEAGVFDDEAGAAKSDLWFAVNGLPTSKPQWAVELLDAYLDRHGRQRLLDAAETRFKVGDDDHWSGDYLMQTATGAPLAFVKAVLPVVLDVVSATASKHDPNDVRHDRLWAFQTVNAPEGGFVDSIYRALDDALQFVATKKPKSFRQFERSLLSVADYQSLAFLLFRSWTSNPTQYWRQAVSFLAEHPTRLRCGYTDSPYWVTRELIVSVQPHATRRALAQLEAVLLSFYPTWEKTSEGRGARGHAQYVLLSGFDKRRLTSPGRLRLRELEDKFGANVERPRGIVGGFVGPPISEIDARKMSDEQWLRAIRKYGTEASREFLKGGPVELSRVLQRLTQDDPERFAALALRLPADSNESYIEALLMGLGQSERIVRPDDVFAVIRQAFRMTGKPGGRWIGQPLARVAESETPEDIVDIVAWYATEHPDPTEELAKVIPGSSGPYYGGDLVNAGINSVRGSAAQALAYLLWPSSEWLPRLRPSLERLVRDRTLAVRACAAWTLASVVRHDLDLAIELLLSLIDADDELLATAPVEELIGNIAVQRLPAARPTLIRMLESRDEATQQAGGRQAALAQLANEEAADVAVIAISGSIPARVGLAQVAARNVSNPDVREPCERWLRKLFNDQDQTVRSTAAEWCLRLEGDSLTYLAPLARHYVETRAHAEQERGLLHALDEAGEAPVADIALRAAELFVARHRVESGDVRRSAILEAPIVSRLAFRGYASAPDDAFKARCLDVIDELVAARARGVEDLVREYDAGRA